MKHPLKTRLIQVLVLCSLSAPAWSVGVGDLPGNQAGPITRQVQQKAQQLVERVGAQAATIRERLAELPSVLPVLTSRGRKAFNDVALDDGSRAVAGQWLVTGTDSEIARLNQPGITILEHRKLSGLGMTVARFEVTAELDSHEALKKALPDLADRLDRNHIYAPQAEAGAAGPGARTPQWRSLCSAPVRIGMVDTSIATDHPVLGNTKIVQKHFLALAEVDGELRAPRVHGTAVASLMVGNRQGQWPARLPEATVFNASVFYDRDRSLSGATLGHLLDGLDWLANQPLSVINISLAGPDNRLLAAAVNSLRKKSILMVAAVGNQGPAAPPLYPAAYKGVIGVTAVDASGELYRWANRGKQVMFAGPGVSAPVAHPDGGMTADSGTSLAAPVVTAALACRRAGLSADQAIEDLIANARDLGEPGRDTSFGHGFLDF